MFAVTIFCSVISGSLVFTSLRVICLISDKFSVESGRRGRGGGVQADTDHLTDSPHDRGPASCSSDQTAV